LCGESLLERNAQVISAGDCNGNTRMLFHVFGEIGVMVKLLPVDCVYFIAAVKAGTGRGAVWNNCANDRRLRAFDQDLAQTLPLPESGCLVPGSGFDGEFLFLAINIALNFD